MILARLRELNEQLRADLQNDYWPWLISMAFLLLVALPVVLANVIVQVLIPMGSI